MARRLPGGAFMLQRDLFSDWPFELDTDAPEAPPARNHLRALPTPASSRLLGIFEAGGRVRVVDPLPPQWLERRDLVSALQALCEEPPELAALHEAEARETALLRLGELALAQGLSFMSEEGTFRPFLLTEGPGGHGLERFCCATLEEARGAAHAYARALSQPVHAYAFVYDGLLPHTGRWTDALFGEVCEAGAGEGRRLAQPFTRAPLLQSLGPAMCVGPSEAWG